MHHPEVDPRFALAFHLGGEQRIGQVLRCKRSNLELEPPNGAIPIDGAGQLGKLRIPRAGRKETAPIVLTPSQREAVDAALKGYLSDYEALWRAGSISDYHLFPAGRFKKGKAKVKVEPLALTRDAALGMFHELERIAGVTEVPGRGWYGVRRIATDIAEDVEKDERVLNNMTGASGLDYSAACIPGSRAAIGAKQGCSNKRPRPPKGYDRFTESGDKAPIPLVREEKTA